MEKRKLNWGQIREQLPDQRSLPQQEEAPFTQLFSLAAARSSFQLEELIAATRRRYEMEEAEEDRAVEQCLAACQLLPRKQGEPPRWQMKDARRQQVLSELSSLARIREFLPENAANSPDVAQRMLADYVSQTAKRLDDQTLEELAATLQVLEWLKAYRESLPRQEEVRFILKKKELLAPFHSLTLHFKGREEELGALRSYVFDGENATRKDPLLVTGIGGVGKTTLLAKFILESIRHSNTSLPFVYIDFDHPGISIKEPLTLLMEIARQLGLQFPRDDKYLADLLQTWARRLRSSSREDLAYEQSSRGISERGFYTYDLGRLWYSLELGDVPLFLVLDSFEEVQVRASEYDILDLLRFIDQLSEQVPRLRTVISGRSEIREFPTQHLEIGDFDEAAAVGYLAARGITERETAAQIFRKVGGNPLTLTLAAGVFAKLEGQPLDSMLRELEAERVQEELFRRNLEHIHQEEVRRLAIPGLVVRRLSPEIIRQVLAGPCGLGSISQERSEELYDNLRKETFLITQETGTGDILFRPDLRRLLIDLAAMQESQKARQIHDLAVTFYSKKNDLVYRAEEIYHRLKRGDQPDELPPVDYEAIRPFLEASIVELSVPAQLFLLRKFNLRPPPALLAQSDDLYWEREMVDEVRISIQKFYEEGIQRLMQRLEQRENRSFNSLLRREEARLYVRMNKLDQARRKALTALQDARKAMDFQAERDMCLLLSDLEERAGHFEKALEWAEKGADLAWIRSKEDALRVREKAISRLNGRLQLPKAAESRPWLSAHAFQEQLAKWRELTVDNDRLEEILESQLGIFSRKIADPGVFEVLSFDTFRYLEERGDLDRVLTGAGSQEPAASPPLEKGTNPLEGLLFKGIRAKIAGQTQNLVSNLTSVKDAVAEGQLEKALTTFTTISRELTRSESNDLILLQSRYNSLKRNVRMGIISNEESDREQNRITHALIDYLDVFSKNLNRFSTFSGDVRIAEVADAPDYTATQLQQFLKADSYLGKFITGAGEEGNGFIVNDQTLITSAELLADAGEVENSRFEALFRESKAGFRPSNVFYPTVPYRSGPEGYAMAVLKLSKGAESGSAPWKPGRVSAARGDWAWLAFLIENQPTLLPLQIRHVDPEKLYFDQTIDLSFALGSPVLDQEGYLLGMMPTRDPYAIRWDIVSEKIS